MILPHVVVPRPPVKRTRLRRLKYSHPKQESLSVRILDLIEQRGGMTAGQIKKQLFEWANPNLVFDKKKNRGWWSTQLYGTGHAGLLNHFCERVGRKWVRNNVDHGYAPWKILKYKSPWKHTASWNANGPVYNFALNPNAMVNLP